MTAYEQQNKVQTENEPKSENKHPRKVLSTFSDNIIADTSAKIWLAAQNVTIFILITNEISLFSVLPNK